MSNAKKGTPAGANTTQETQATAPTPEQVTAPITGKTVVEQVAAEEGLSEEETQAFQELLKELVTEAVAQATQQQSTATTPTKTHPALNPEYCEEIAKLRAQQSDMSGKILSTEKGLALGIHAIRKLGGMKVNPTIAGQVELNGRKMNVVGLSESNLSNLLDKMARNANISIQSGFLGKQQAELSSHKVFDLSTGTLNSVFIKEKAKEIGEYKDHLKSVAESTEVLNYLVRQGKQSALVLNAHSPVATFSDGSGDYLVKNPAYAPPMSGMIRFVYGTPYIRWVATKIAGKPTLEAVPSNGIPTKAFAPEFKGDSAGLELTLFGQQPNNPFGSPMTQNNTLGLGIPNPLGQVNNNLSPELVALLQGLATVGQAFAKAA